MEVPEDVFHDPEALKTFLIRGGDPRRDGEALVSYLEGWLERHPVGPAAERAQAERVLVELQTQLEFLYSQDLQVARLQDELDMLRADQERKIDSLRVQYRRMVFWRGRDDDDVRAAAEWVQGAFAPEIAARILDTDDLFDDDIPDERASRRGDGTA